MNSTVLFFAVEILMIAVIVLLVITMKKDRWVNIISIVLLAAAMVMTYVAFKGFDVQTVEDLYTDTAAPVAPQIEETSESTDVIEETTTTTTTDVPVDDTTDVPVDDTTDVPVDDTTDVPVDDTADVPVDDVTDELEDYSAGDTTTVEASDTDIEDIPTTESYE